MSGYIRILVELVLRILDEAAAARARRSDADMAKEMEYQVRRNEVLKAHKMGDRRRLYRLWTGRERMPVGGRPAAGSGA